MRGRFQSQSRITLKFTRAVCVHDIGLTLVTLIALFGAALRSPAQSPPIRAPLGVFVHFSIEDALNRYDGPTPATEADYRAYLNPIEQALLADPAISGITV